MKITSEKEIIISVFDISDYKPTKSTHCLARSPMGAILDSCDHSVCVPGNQFVINLSLEPIEIVARTRNIEYIFLYLLKSVLTFFQYVLHYLLPE